MGFFSGVTLFKRKDETPLGDCSIIMLAENTSVKHGDEIVFSIGICNQSEDIVEAGAMECYITFDNDALEFAEYDDKRPGTKIGYPKLDAPEEISHRIKLSRIGTMFEIPANSTFIMGIVHINTKNAVPGAMYEIYLSDCFSSTYDGRSLNVPDESNKIVFTIE